MIFPGQGSQFVGMAKEFYDKERIVQEYFDEATHCLGLNFVKLCFASSENELMEMYKLKEKLKETYIRGVKGVTHVLPVKNGNEFIP